jgi:hypothetical protein
MSDFQIINKNKDNFVVDWDVIERLLKSIYTTQYQLVNSTINPMKPSGGFNPREEVLWTVDVDWDTVTARTARDIRLEMPALRSWAKVDPRGVAKELEHRVELAGGFRQDFLDKLKWVSSRNVQNIDKAVAAYDADIKMARLVRDTAADLFVVAASIETGGAAATIYSSLGSAGKGYAKFQDTGNYGAAVLEGAGTFVFSAAKIKGVTPFGLDFSGGAPKAVLVLIQAPYKTYTELVSGASVGDAVASGAVKLIAPGLDQFFKMFSGTALKMFANCALPIEITTSTNENVAANFLSKALSKVTQQGLKQGAKSLMHSASRTTTATVEQPGPLIDQVTLTNKSLLYHGFYNVDKGPGGGW